MFEGFSCELRSNCGKAGRYVEADSGHAIVIVEIDESPLR
jgi:hypothetical protein